MPVTVFAACARPFSTSPISVTSNGDTGPGMGVDAGRPGSAALKACSRFPFPGSGDDGSSQRTLSSAAAWIASHSLGATTPTKFPTRTTFAPPMCLIELSSIERTCCPPPANNSSV